MRSLSLARRGFHLFSAALISLAVALAAGCSGGSSSGETGRSEGEDGAETIAAPAEGFDVFAEKDSVAFSTASKPVELPLTLVAAEDFQLDEPTVEVAGLPEYVTVETADSEQSGDRMTVPLMFTLESATAPRQTIEAHVSVVVGDLARELSVTVQVAPTSCA
jgi:hypothetical protein